MKKAFLLHLIIFPMLLHAQNLFNQKKTKLKYIKQQIALFEVYAGYLKDGYETVGDGLSLINDIKHGDFNLHNNYFSSLSKVNKSILDYAQADSIENLQLRILQIQSDLDKFTQNNKHIQPQERDYINRVMSNLLFQCSENLDLLTTLTTNGVIELKDDESLQQIDAIVSDMKGKYTFARHFESSVRMLALSRAKEANDIDAFKNLYQIN